MDLYLLGANAVLAFFGKETGFERIEKIFEKSATGDCQLYFHAANAYEIYYQFHRDKGKISALAIWEDMRRLPLTILYTFDEEFVKVAAETKAAFKMSVADSFLLAQAVLLNAVVVTADHHELDVVEQASTVKFFWFR
jgi:predicted nucleic acid-binding protein